jgi:hypothetical protein
MKTEEIVHKPNSRRQEPTNGFEVRAELCARSGVEVCPPGKVLVEVTVTSVIGWTGEPVLVEGDGIEVVVVVTGGSPDPPTSLLIACQSPIAKDETAPWFPLSAFQ